MSNEKRTPEVDSTYDTSKSYNQLVYGRYIFIAKVAGVVALLLVGLYMLLTNIGKSLKTETNLLTIENFLAQNEKERARFRQKVQLMLMADLLKYRVDTVFIAVDDSAYLFPQEKGVYRFPEESAVYGCKLESIELLLKRGLFEMKYPFAFTRVVHKNDLSQIDLKNYTRKEGVFPLYITNKIASRYSVVPADTQMAAKVKTMEIALPDSMIDYFNSLYAKSSAKTLLEKYAGTGDCGPYRHLSLEAFSKLTLAEQQEQRRAFLKLSESEQAKVRIIEVGVSSAYGCVPVDEKPGSNFATLAERKMHELELSTMLTPLFDVATFSLQFPMARIYNKEFSALGANANAVRLVALKSGRAPAHYPLELKDCPRLLKQGMYADITDYFKNWDQVQSFPTSPVRQTTYMGRHYGIPSKVMTADALVYRRDWLEEPALLAWCKKKGWIHPQDKRPYIPLHWTYNEFRELIKLIADSDPQHKRKGYVDRSGPMMYLDAYAGGHGIGGLYLRVNPSQKTTWIFNKDDTVFVHGLKMIHDIYWKDKSVRSGVEVTYQSAGDDFKGGRAGIAQMAAHGVLLGSLAEKYSVFGNARPYGEIVGLTNMPGNEEYERIATADCNMLGFNPFLNKPQLDVAFEWIKQKYYGEFVNNSLFYEVTAARLLGTESVVFRNAIASPYVMDYSKFDIDFRTVFPANYVEFYDNLRLTQRVPQGPRLDEFGLQDVGLRQIQDRVYIMFEKVLMDSVPNYEDVLNETANYVNNTILNFKDDNSAQKLKQYAEAQLEFTRRYTPEDYEKTKVLFDKQKVW